MKKCEKVDRTQVCTCTACIELNSEPAKQYGMMNIDEPQIFLELEPTNNPDLLQMDTHLTTVCMVSLAKTWTHGHVHGHVDTREKPTIEGESFEFVATATWMWFEPKMQHE